MHDRPTRDELLAAVEHFLDTEIVPNVPGSRGFHARVAANAVRIVRRELAAEEEQVAAEWAALNELLGAAKRPAGREALVQALLKRNAEVCERIRKGDGDKGEYRAKVLTFVRNRVREKLRVSDPGLLERSGEAT